MENTDEQGMNQTLQKQYDSVKKLTKLSHVMQVSCRCGSLLNFALTVRRHNIHQYDADELYGRQEQNRLPGSLCAFLCLETIGFGSVWTGSAEQLQQGQLARCQDAHALLSLSPR